MPKHVVDNKVLVDGVAVGAGNKTYEKTGEAGFFEEPIAVGTNIPVGLSLDVSAVESCIIYSDRVVTIKTNSSGSPTDTLVMKAGIGYRWNKDSYDTFKLTGDITGGLYVTNASGGGALLTFHAVIDPTPA